MMLFEDEDAGFLLALSEEGGEETIIHAGFSRRNETLCGKRSETWSSTGLQWTGIDCPTCKEKAIVRFPQLKATEALFATIKNTNRKATDFMSPDKTETDQTSKAHPTEEQARRLAAEAATVMAEVFLTQGWTLRGIDAIPTTEQLEAVVRFCLQEALTPTKRFLPEYAKGPIKVQVHPDLSVAEVWLRVGDLQWVKPDQEDTRVSGDRR